MLETSHHFVWVNQSLDNHDVWLQLLFSTFIVCSSGALCVFAAGSLPSLVSVLSLCLELSVLNLG